MHANDYMNDCEGLNEQGATMPTHTTSTLSAHEKEGCMQADPFQPVTAMFPAADTDKSRP